MNQTEMLEATSFQDMKGRTWSLLMSWGQMKRLKTEHDFDVMEVASPEGIDRLVGDQFLVMDMMATVLASQLKERDITAVELFESIGGDQVEQAVWSFITACCFFFPSIQKPALLELVSKMRHGNEQLGSLIASKVSQIELPTSTSGETTTTPEA